MSARDAPDDRAAGASTAFATAETSSVDIVNRRLVISEWDPLEEMRPHEYLLFKLRRWVSVEMVSEWVDEAAKGYYDGYRDKYGHRLYDEEKVFTGDSLKYRVNYHNDRGRKIKPVFEVRIK